MMMFLGLIFAVCFYFSRVHRKYILTLCIESACEVVIILYEWKNLGGFDSSLISLILVLFIIKPLLVNFRYHLYVSGFYALVLFAIFYLDIYYQHLLVIPYQPSDVDRLQVIVNFGIIGLVIFFFKREYEKRLEEKGAIQSQLENALVKEKELNQIKTEFIQMVSHQFRTPLTSIYSSTELLDLSLQNEGLATEKNKLKIDRIYDAVNLLTGMLEKLLAFEKVDSEAIRVRKINSNCILLVKDCVDKFNFKNESKINVSVSYINSPKPVSVDPTLFKEVIHQLLENAIKFSENDAKINIDLGFTDTYFKLKISDKGIGIPETDIEHIFDPFFRSQNAKNIKGNGIGLVFAKKFVSLHDGIISVESKEGIGTVFKLSFPY